MRRIGEERPEIERTTCPGVVKAERIAKIIAISG